MKRLFIIFICIAGLSLNVDSQEQSATERVQSYSEQELKYLKDEYKILSDANVKIVKELKEERKNHQDYVESLYKWVAIFFGIICTLFGSIFTFLGIKTKKDVEKEMNDKLSRELNTTFNRLAAELKTNPDALKAAISEKSIEIELKNDYPITILHTAEKDELNNAKNMKNVLTAFGFKIVQNTLRNNASGNKFSENDIIVLFSNIKQEEQELLGEIKKSNCAILGFGTFNDVKEDALTLKHLKEYVANKECVTFCNSFATLYQNLISLLHYKREVNKTIG